MSTCVCGHHQSVHQWIPYHRADCTVCMTCDRRDTEHDTVTTHNMNRCPCNTYTPQEESA